MKTVAIIQGRMTSRRLPGKILMDIEGKPLLWHVMKRAEASGVFDAVLFATSLDPSDDAVEAFCRAETIPCFRGDLDDVLGRYQAAAASVGADIITRLTADCPLLDPAVIRKVVQAFDPKKHDYVSNVLERTYPKGLDTEVFSRATLDRIAAEAVLPGDREHVTMYIRNNLPLFRTANVRQECDLSALRWTVDEPADLAFVRAVYKELGTGTFGQEEILKLLERRPALQKINAPSAS